MRALSGPAAFELRRHPNASSCSCTRCSGSNSIGRNADHCGRFGARCPDAPDPQSLLHRDRCAGAATEADSGGDGRPVGAGSRPGGRARDAHGGTCGGRLAGSRPAEPEVRGLRGGGAGLARASRWPRFWSKGPRGSRHCARRIALAGSAARCCDTRFLRAAIRPRFRPRANPFGCRSRGVSARSRCSSLYCRKSRGFWFSRIRPDYAWRQIRYRP